jgi:hypothetical protein
MTAPTNGIGVVDAAIGRALQVAGRLPAKGYAPTASDIIALADVNTMHWDARFPFLEDGDDLAVGEMSLSHAHPSCTWAPESLTSAVY